MPLLSAARRCCLASGLAVALLAGCASTGAPQSPPMNAPADVVAASPPPADAAPTAPPFDDGDPFEGLNRAVYQFNDVFDYYVGKPVAKGYRAVLPAAVRRGMSNFFNNLREPIVIVSDVLQAKFVQAIQDTGRFVTNTTVGLLGFFDPAAHLGMPRHDEDLGQTLGAWGVGDGPYLVLPFLGPRNLRDTVGLVGDWQLWAPNWIPQISSGERNALVVVNFVDTRAGLLDATDILTMAAGQDPYVFVREAYRQRRLSQIHDGRPPQAAKDIEQLLFEEEPAPPERPRGEAAPPAPAP